MSLTIGQANALAGLRSPTSRATILIALAAGLATGFLVGHGGGSASVDADLMRLLRAMAALKLLFVAVVTATLVWRLQAQSGILQFALYAITVFAMAAGPGLIWNLTHVVLGAALLHAGLLASLLLLWRDPEIGTLLNAAIARRRAS